MSSRRRAARARTTTRQGDAAIPPALTDRTDPAWTDARRAVETVGRWLDLSEDTVGA